MRRLSGPSDRRRDFQLLRRHDSGGHLQSNLQRFGEQHYHLHIDAGEKWKRDADPRMKRFEHSQLLSLCLICTRCPFVDRDNCGKDGQAIMSHAMSGECPVGRFPDHGGVEGTDAADAAIPGRTGPGELVSRILGLFGFQSTCDGVICPNGSKLEKCGCCAMKSRMNELGYIGCLRHRRELVEWFVAKARECGVEIGGPTALSLLWAGLRQWRRRAD